MENNGGETNFADNQEMPKKKQRFKLYFIIASVLIIVGAIAAVFIVKAAEKKRQEMEAQRQAIIQSGVFHEGIYVNGVSLSALTMEQAADILKKEEEKISGGIAFSLRADDQEYPVTAEIYQPVYNTKHVLEEAMAIGREGTLLELQTLLQDLAVNNKHFEIAYEVSESAVLGYVSELAQKLDRAPEDAHFKLLVDKERILPNTNIKEADVKKAALTTHEERMQYVSEVDGRALKQEELKNALLQMANSGQYQDMDVPFEVIRPDITLDNIESRIVLRAAFSTSFAKSPYNRSTRVFNILKSAALINGTVLAPGDVFSTNDALGNRTYSNGWQPAPAIVQGRTEDQAGGGVCQVSTTLYNCVLMADLEVVYRQAHSGRLGYIDGGLDATIDSGRIDFKWKNNTDDTLYLFSWVDLEKKRIHMEIYGAPLQEEYDEIKLSSKKVETISPPGEMKYTIDYTKPTGYKEVFIQRKSGLVYQSYATYLKNGEVVKTEPVARTVYRAYAGETIIGPPAPPAYGYPVYE